MRVGEHDLDLDRGLLTRNGVPVHLRAKTFRLLCHLAGHPGRVISKDELIEAVWPEVSVTEDSLTQAIRDLRRVLGDEAIRTVSRRGYFLDAPNGADTMPEPARMARKAGTSDPPVIVVLPLQTLSEDSSTAVLVDGMVEEIIQWLGRYGLVEVAQAAISQQQSLCSRAGTRCMRRRGGTSLNIPKTMPASLPMSRRR